MKIRETKGDQMKRKHWIQLLRPWMNQKLNLIQHFQLVVQMIQLFLNKDVLLLHNN